jgi:hypothetical protein
VLLLNFHHAIIDEWSMGLLLQELAEPEAEESDGKRPPVEACHFRLPGLGPAERDRCVRFWRETLADASGEVAWPGRWTPWDGGPTGGMHRFGIGADRGGDNVTLVLLETHRNCRVPWGAWWRWMATMVPELVVKHATRLTTLPVVRWPRYLLDRLLPVVGLRSSPGPQARPADSPRESPANQSGEDPYLHLIQGLAISPADFEIVHVGVDGALAANAELFRGLTSRACTAYRLPGSHHDVLRQPNAAVVASILRRCFPPGNGVDGEGDRQADSRDGALNR